MDETRYRVRFIYDTWIDATSPAHAIQKGALAIGEDSAEEIVESLVALEAMPDPDDEDETAASEV